MSEPQDYNAEIIDEFRANGGKVGGPFEGFPLLLLHSTGAKTGKERLNPLAYRTVGDVLAIFASAAGADKNPDWFYNLVANPKAKVEVGTDVVDVNARVASPQERNEIWERQKADAPAFADYEAKTSRQIPVVLLEPTA